MSIYATLFRSKIKFGETSTSLQLYENTLLYVDLSSKIQLKYSKFCVMRLNGDKSAIIQY